MSLNMQEQDSVWNHAYLLSELFEARVFGAPLLQHLQRRLLITAVSFL